MILVKKIARRCLFDSQNRAIHKLRDVLNSNCSACLTNLQQQTLNIKLQRCHVFTSLNCFFASHAATTGKEEQRKRGHKPWGQTQLSDNQSQSQHLGHSSQALDDLQAMIGSSHAAHQR